jgi:uncharacterized metal-binding protein
MPSGKTHDLITLSLALPTAGATWLITGQIGIVCAVTMAMLFGGLMFGPDLDLHSVQYSRWGLFRILWLPYRALFSHRSRLTHGLLFGTIIRVMYFSMMVILVTALIVLLRDIYLLGKPTGVVEELERTSRNFWKLLNAVDRNYLFAAFIGAWWGAASHTLSDLIFTVGKQTKKIF